MPKLRTPEKDKHARIRLYGGNKSALIRNTCLSRTTLYRRIERPGSTTLDELADLVREQALTAEELYQLVTERG